jgi:ABC-type metal ion transport system, periplasmic component/surface adhesin
MKQIILLFTALWGVLSMSSCGERQIDENVVSVTIEPQRFFAEKIAGDRFIIKTVVPSGQNPEMYDPTPQQMVQVSRSRAYLKIGHIPFETAWMPSVKANSPGLDVFDMSEGMLLIEQHPHDHDHADGEDHCHHSHVGADPHTWSSISGAKTIAWNTLNAFTSIDKENTEYYWNNYNKLIALIDSVDMEIKTLIEPLSNRSFIIYHPSLTYFAREFQLEQLSIEMEGKEPSPSQLKRLIDTSKKSGAKVVFVQQEFDKKNAEVVSNETDCKLVVINPLSYNWDEEIIHIAKSLADGEIN